MSTIEFVDMDTGQAYTLAKAVSETDIEQGSLITFETDTERKVFRIAEIIRFLPSGNCRAIMKQAAQFRTNSPSPFVTPNEFVFRLDILMDSAAQQAMKIYADAIESTDRSKANTIRNLLLKARGKKK